MVPSMLHVFQVAGNAMNDMLLIALVWYGMWQYTVWIEDRRAKRTGGVE